MENSDEKYMKEALKEACAACEEDEVPVGAVVVCEGRIIGRGHNMTERLGDPTAHAEMIAIRIACQKLKSWHLDGCVLYSTLEPCIMCSGAIIQSRIKKVVYAAKGQRWHGLSTFLQSHEFNHHPQIVAGILEEQCCSLLSYYFKEKRKH